MTPAEKLREIVAAAKGDELEWVEMMATGSTREGYRATLEIERQRRAEWQAASDLLERLLAGRRASKEDRA